MAGLNQAKQFWKTTREVSVKEIEREAKKGFSIAIIGDPARRQEVLKQLFPDSREGDVIPERSLILSFDSSRAEDGFPTDVGSDYLVIDAGGGRSEEPTAATIYSVEELGSAMRAFERLLEQRPDLSLSMARRFPGLRHVVSEKIIRDTALANAEFSMLNALPGVIPIIAPLLPATAIGDIFMLTKNQTMMMFRLAAAHDLPLDLKARSRDLGPLLGNAFGWRAIARELIAIVPGGVGLAARGAISYAGTAAVGKTLLRFYEYGELPTKELMSRFYKETLAGAREIVRERLKFLKRPGRQSISQNAQITQNTESLENREDGAIVVEQIPSPQETLALKATDPLD